MQHAHRLHTCNMQAGCMQAGGRCMGACRRSAAGARQCPLLLELGVDAAQAGSIVADGGLLGLLRAVLRG